MGGLKVRRTGQAHLANSLCPAEEKGTLHKPEVQSDILPVRGDGFE
jgi:hypothetical protein